MRALVVIAVLLAAAAPAGATTARVVKDDQGMRLEVDGRPLLVRGINWGYSPIGTNYSYSLWSQPDPFIERVLRRDMALLQRMRVNMIRQFSDVPPRWVKWIHDEYGIYTVIDHFMGRYGAIVDGVWIEKIDYRNPRHRQALLADLAATVERYKDVPGVAMWILGNENNYGLAWTGFDAENLPAGERDRARAAALYSLMGEAIATIKARDTAHPVAIANGDLQYLDLIKEHCRGLDIFGANVYRGPSARDFFQRVDDTLGVPAMFTEFGADAYDARHDREDAATQAEVLRAQWHEIYQQSWGKGRAGNAIGGFVFQWVDGWWKSSQEERLDVHDTTATWATDAYADFVPGQNNMNEEWFGIVAIGDQDPDGFYEVQPRIAYDVLREAFRLDPYAAGVGVAEVDAHFDAIEVEDYRDAYDGRRAAAQVGGLGKVRVSGLRLRFETNATSGDARTSRADAPLMDHTESFLVDFTVTPTPRVSGRLSLSIVGHAAQNRLDPLFWENRTPPKDPAAAQADVAADEAGDASDLVDPLHIYQAELHADYPYLTLDGFYRVGHGHWGYEGDFFGLYREAYYGPNIDIYHGEAPFGVVLSGKRELAGLKIAAGTELYWGANPSIIAKVTRPAGPVVLTVVHQEDLAENQGARTSSAVAEPLTRRSALHARWGLGRATVDAGVLFAAPQRVEREFTYTSPSDGMGYLGSGVDVFTGRVRWIDTLGARAKVSFDGGRVRWYAEGGVRGLVADAGGDWTTTFTGWTVKASGRGNQVNALGGALLSFGSFQIAPNVLWQRPIVGPNPVIPDRVEMGVYYPGVRPRNVLDDPFAVLDNRETIAGELLVVWDPTPGTWFWAWDRERREDAPFAFAVDTVYRHQPTARDASVVILADGSQVPAAAAPPAADVWETTFSWSAALPRRWRLGGALYVGQDQARAGDPRLVFRGGGSLRLVRDGLRAGTEVKVRDWGPYDYHRDFNLTYPLQWYGELSYGLPRSLFGATDTRVGVRWQLRFLDGHSEGYVADPAAPTTQGREGEVLTYVLVSL